MPSRAMAIASESLGDRSLTELEMSLSTDIQYILLKAGRESAKKCNQLKWKRFLLWISDRDIDPVSVPVQSILEYFLYMKHKGFTSGPFGHHSRLSCRNRWQIGFLS